ncbi:hypothetical protein TSAR_013861 [Trichomalopsis sarcophagae]|uniref:RNA helicase n=1 Tax=Trichomalopsis sarcophagae TaxID=543379 RepID=A0A232ENG5_9HYME|nr:hypothetical protein TSAR_013861 [Trichomalopsis sarcophagae]
MYPQVLCLSPTYESAKQTVEVATRMSKFCREIKIKFAIAGVEMAKKSNKIEEHLIIGIPGKVMDCRILQFKFVDTKKISVMVVDEADIMTEKSASWLAEKMTVDWHSVTVLSNDLTMDREVCILNRFRVGLAMVLITTSVLAQVINVNQVKVVINFDLPMDEVGEAHCETYLHRNRKDRTTW